MASRYGIWSAVFAGSLAFSAVFSACGDGGEGGSTSGNTGSGAGTNSGGAGGNATIPIESLAIDPIMAVLEVDQNTPKMQVFTATGTLADGSTKPVPATFSVDNIEPGDIDPATGNFTTNNAAGGIVKVTATYGGKSASADLTVLFKPVVQDGTLPPDVPGKFDPNTNTPVPNDPLSPEIVYPSNETMFPTNVYKILFQWRAKGLKLFHVRFEGQFIDLSIYTDGAHPTCVGAQSGGGCWEATQKIWKWLASSAAGKSVKLTVEASDPMVPGQYYVGNSIDISFSKNAVPGAIYYWSTTSAGVMRATVSDAAPSRFMTPTEVNQCVACHTLSRNGKKLAADVGGENLWVVDVNNIVPPPVVFNQYNNKNIPNAWATFNPDATRVISARSGLMRLFDGDKGVPIGANNGAIDLAGKFGTQPDWAPDGQHIAFAYGTNNKDRGVQGSSIAMLEQSADQFSNLTIVRQSMASSDTYAYPMFDPTSQWIVYTHVTGASDKNAAAKLYIAPATPGASESDLERANTIVADTVVPVGIANNMATWAPVANGDDTRWIAFASKRDYGLVLASNSKYGDDKQQLWVAAIDPKKLGSGDPSYPAFRLPFQLLNEDNHRPFWAEDAIMNPCDGGAGGGCGTGGAGGGGGTGGGGGGACINVGDDCSAGVCCAGLICAPNPQGTTYVCQFIN